MSGIFVRMEEGYEKFTKLEKKVADFVLENPQKVLYTSITDLAEMCGVGDTTVFRFCKALKLNGYQDFKMLLAQDIANNNGANNVVGAIDLQDDVKTVCEKALTTNIAALNETFNLLDFNAVSKAAELMSSAKRIHFFGMGSYNSQGYYSGSSITNCGNSMYYSSANGFSGTLYAFNTYYSSTCPSYDSSRANSIANSVSVISFFTGNCLISIWPLSIHSKASLWIESKSPTSTSG